MSKSMLLILKQFIMLCYPQALYLIINNRSMLSMSLTMTQAYEAYGDEDGFLYITYASQEVFGYKDGKFLFQTDFYSDGLLRPTGDSVTGYNVVFLFRVHLLFRRRFI